MSPSSGGATGFVNTGDGQSIAYEDLPGSGAASASADRKYVRTRKIKIGWDDQLDFLRHLFGASFLTGQGVTRVRGASYPGEDILTAATVSVENFDDLICSRDDGSFYYPNGAVLTVTYEPYPNVYGGGGDDNAGLLATEAIVQLDIGGEIMTLPSDGLRWSTGGTAGESVRAGMIIPTTSFSVQLTNVPELPLDTIRALRGTVNKTTFLGAPPGTVLFGGAKARRSYDPLGATDLWALDLQFDEKAIRHNGQVYGWNYFYRDDAEPGSSPWQLLLTSDNYAIYPEGEHNDLLSSSPS